MAAGAVTAPSIIPLRVPVAGKSQTEIDTSTYIELKTDFPDAQIHFTIDGSKPNPYQQIGEVRKTQQYRKPFLLQEGKKIVRAVAVTKTRESNTVSKTFSVQWVPGQEKYETDDESFQDRIGRNQTPGLQLTASKTTAAILKKVLEESQKPVQGSNYRKPTTGTRFMEARMGSKPAKVKAKQNEQKPSSPAPEDKGRSTPKNMTQANRMQRETDFLKCIFCAADRPADPFARFCIACGNPVPPLPNARLPPPEPAQLGMCVGCNAMVPLNVSNCLICEMPIAPQLVPQASVKLKDKLVCNECGTGNPANMEYCVTCECRLTGNNRHLKMTWPEATYSGMSAPPMPMIGGRLLCCNKCGRVNNSDARYCDWCGAKPAPTTHLLTCSRCQSSNQAYATFCHSCGCSIDPPVREDPRNNSITVGGKSTSQVIDKQTKAAWVPMSMPRPEPEKTGVGTQTAGLFFPSNKRLEQQGKGDPRTAMESTTEKKPVLTAVSPGKGYWRQQMDHICGHLKAHAQNNQDFRNLIAEPRMGKLQGSTVHEDGYELSITACFILRGNRDEFTGKPLGITKKSLLSDASDGTDQVPNRTGTATETPTKPEKTATPKKKPKKKATDDKLTPIDKDLLREVSARGDGDDEEVQRLLDEGADATCENSDGIPVLTLAVMNKHWDCLETLVNNGAEINKKAGPKGNTALHEAVLLGNDGRHGVEDLLSLGASSKVRNTREETAYDQAIKGGEESVISLFASTAGQGMLDKLMKQSSRPPAKRF